MSDDRILLRRAFIDATLISADNICATEKTVKYSDRHRKRISSMGISAGISTKAKILIAVIAAALLLTGCAIFHEQIAGLILSFGDGFVIIEGDKNNAPEEIEHAYVATYIPEGFTEIERVEDVFFCNTKWVNEEKERYFLLTQDTVYSSSYDVDTEHSTSVPVYINDLCVLKINNKGFSFYYWEYRGYLFSITANFELDDYTFSLILNGLE